MQVAVLLKVPGKASGLFILASLFFSQPLMSQDVIHVYKGKAPGSEDWNWTEGETTKNPTNTKIVYNVTTPTLTLFSPAPEISNGCAVIIVPGGGGRVLLFEKEGEMTARHLVKKGITVFVLKYRLAQTKTDDPWTEMMASLRDSAARRGSSSSPQVAMARADLVAAIRHVRKHADKYKIDKNRVGLVGFSAGAVMAMNTIYNADLDAVPDFAAINYGIMRTVQKAPFREKVPPLFIAAAADDQLAPATNSIELFNEWYAAKIPVELHIYAKGKSDVKGAPPHGLNGAAASTWIDRFVEWLNTQDLLHRKP
jgi:acetyl esterase/lipase